MNVNISIDKLLDLIDKQDIIWSKMCADPPVLIRDDSLRCEYDGVKKELKEEFDNIIKKLSKSISENIEKYQGEFRGGGDTHYLATEHFEIEYRTKRSLLDCLGYRDE